MIDSVGTYDFAPRSQAYICFDRLNIAESLRTAVLGRAHSQQKVGKVLKGNPSSGLAAEALQILPKDEDSGANGVLAVNPGKRISPRICLSSAPVIVVDIPYSKAS
jgi:hypothetical protein